MGKIILQIYHTDRCFPQVEIPLQMGAKKKIHTIVVYKWSMSTTIRNDPINWGWYSLMLQIPCERTHFGLQNPTPKATCRNRFGPFQRDSLRLVLVDFQQLISCISLSRPGPWIFSRLNGLFSLLNMIIPKSLSRLAIGQVSSMAFSSLVHHLPPFGTSKSVSFPMSATNSWLSEAEANLGVSVFGCAGLTVYSSHRIHGTGIFTYIWLIFMVNVGIYTIHGSYGHGIFSLVVSSKGFLGIIFHKYLLKKRGLFRDFP